MAVAKKAPGAGSARREREQAPKAAPAARPGKASEAAAPKQRIRVLAAPFEARSILGKLGAWWSPEAKAWLAEGELTGMLADWAAQPYSWEALVEASINGDEPVDEPGKAPPTLRPHQVEAVKAGELAYFAGLPGFLMADEVGLGKTYSAWGAARSILAKMAAGKPKGWRPDVLVVCTLSVAPHWRRSIQAMGAGGCRPLVLNYDRMQKLFAVDEEKRSKVKTRKGLVRHGEAPSFDLVIFDESHKMKNPTAARSKMGAKIASQAGFCLWLSATAGQTPLELSYLAPLLAAKTGERLSAVNKDFEAWCKQMQLGVTQGKFGRWEWDGSKESRSKIRALLFEPSGKWPAAALRRRPEEIAGWPPIQRIVWPVELEPKEKALYEAAWDEFKSSWREKGEAYAKALKERKAAKSAAGAALVAALRFRQKSSLLRTELTADFALDLLDEGRQVAVSCAFRESAQEIKGRLEKAGVACAVIDGTMPVEAREAERVAFQTGKKTAIVFTVEEGISLHEGEMEGGGTPRALLIHDLRWSALQTAQIEGRCHRDGKSAPAYWMLAEDTIEARVGERLANRLASTKALSGDDEEAVEELGRALLAELGGSGERKAA